MSLRNDDFFILAIQTVVAVLLISHLFSNTALVSVYLIFLLGLHRCRWHSRPFAVICFDW